MQDKAHPSEGAIPRVSHQQWAGALKRKAFLPKPTGRIREPFTELIHKIKIRLTIRTEAEFFKTPFR